MLAQRNNSLDALRGLAILAMILSGSIAFGGVLPAWMYHAQEPPPLHQFNPLLPGITWVDLVFPFFLFSMGAAIPLAMQQTRLRSTGPLLVISAAIRRFLLLAFFALFTQHLKAWVINPQPAAKEQLLSLLAFLLLFGMLYRHKAPQYRTLFAIVRTGSFATAILLLYLLPFHGGKGFNWYKSDIIIMVLANMALFAAIIYYFTAGRPLLRIGLLPFVMAIFLAAKEPEAGWAKAVYNFSHVGFLHFDWLYQFYFLKYLFIVLPGTVAGEWLLKAAAPPPQGELKATSHTGKLLAGVSFLLLLVNLAGLFTRQLTANLWATVLLCGIAWWLLKRLTAAEALQYRHFVQAGIYLLLLGLFWEAYEGGIKKDHSTYSYYFVAAGLAFFILVLLMVLAKFRAASAAINYLALNGRNPMVAYVAGSLVLLPLLHLTGLITYFDALNTSAAAGLLKGVLFTGLVSLLTVWMTKRGWYWRT